MKNLLNLNKFHIFLIAFVSVSIGMYYYNYIENFQGSTANTLLNLPSWFVYTILIFIMICILLTMFLQFLPWMYGIKTAGNLGGRAINGYFGKKNSVIPVKPINGTS